MNITIRHARIEDTHQIGEAEREIAKEPGFFCSAPSELTDENVANIISAFLKDKNGVYLVAEYEGKLVGHAFLEPFHTQSLRHIADLNVAVHVGWQKKGIGTMLLEQIIQWAKDSGILEKIQLNVRASNSSAISLYKKMGFQEEGRLKNRVKVKDHYIDDIVMGLDLMNDQQVMKIDNIEIRKIEEKDVDNLITTFCFPWSSIQETTEKWARYFVEHQKQIRTVYLLEKQGTLMGYASILYLSAYPDFRNAGIPEINDLWISEEYRGKGLGKQFICHLEGIACTEGYKQIGLGVGLYSDYGRAQRLYCKQGYVPDGKGITYKTSPVIPGKKYPVDDDLILWMVKSLI